MRRSCLLIVKLIDTGAFRDISGLLYSILTKLIVPFEMVLSGVRFLPRNQAPVGTQQRLRVSLCRHTA
jgi:hypothetical protein